MGASYIACFGPSETLGEFGIDIGQEKDLVLDFILLTPGLQDPGIVEGENCDDVVALGFDTSEHGQQTRNLLVGTSRGECT